MSNDDERKSRHEEFQRMLAEEHVVVGPFLIDAPMQVNLQSTGNIQIDSYAAMTIPGAQHSPIFRLELTPHAVKGLKTALAKFEEENDYPNAFLDTGRSKQ